jgi:protein-S-isoprenylcysteine O-methyltransferase Ste14
MGATASTPAQITINSADADVPIVPPIVLLFLLAVAALLAIKLDRFSFLPDSLRSLKVRTSIFVLGFGTSLHVHFSALEQLHDAGSGVAFTPTAGIAIGGPYEYTRNPFYSLLIFVQMPLLALLFDSAWIICMMAPMFVWLSAVVIPGEEAFLSRNFGSEYNAYLASTPRWLF